MITYIVPVYNGEKTLKRCIDSILLQEICHEIIIINDGSDDNTENILNSYKNAEKIKVIKVENGGVSKARNLGIELSSGKYIRFIDADDFLPENSSRLLMSPFYDTDVKLSIGSSTHFSSTGDELNSYLHKSKIISIENSVNENLLLNNSLGVCDKLFLASKIKDNKIFFNAELHNYEDFLFVLQYLKFCDGISDRVTYIEDVVYFYTESTKSATRDVINAKQLSFIKSFEKINCLLSENNKLYFLRNKVKTILRYLIKLNKDGRYFPEEENEMYVMMKKSLLLIIKNPKVWDRNFIFYFLLFFFPKISVKLIGCIK